MRLHPQVFCDGQILRLMITKEIKREGRVISDPAFDGITYAILHSAPPLVRSRQVDAVAHAESLLLSDSSGPGQNRVRYAHPGELPNLVVSLQIW